MSRFGFYDNRDNKNNGLIVNSMLSVDNNKNNFYQPKCWLPLDPIFTFVALNQRSPAERKGKAQKRIAQGRAKRHPGCNWSLSMRAVSAKALNILLLSTLLRFQRDKRKTWLKWQPAFRLVKVVFVVVNRQHRVHNQTVVPVVSVVVKTKAQMR